MEPLTFTFYFTVEGYDVFITIELFPHIYVIMAESTKNSSWQRHKRTPRS